MSNEMFVMTEKKAYVEGWRFGSDDGQWERRQTFPLQPEFAKAFKRGYGDGKKSAAGELPSIVQL